MCYIVVIYTTNWICARLHIQNEQMYYLNPDHLSLFGSISNPYFIDKCSGILSSSIQDYASWIWTWPGYSQ